MQRKEKEERDKPKLEAAIAECTIFTTHSSDGCSITSMLTTGKPKENEALTSDAYKTLFIGRLVCFCDVELSHRHL
jgi:hypothetical protein